jgi:hypothetical protein
MSESPEARRDAALKLLASSTSRQKVDSALRTLSSEAVSPFLSDEHRPILRDKAAYYFDAPPDKDKGGLIRELILRLLVKINHPDDKDLYLRGVKVYHRQPVNDSAQALRATSLVGLVSIDADLACAYAVKLLGEPDTSILSGEPSLTALSVLVTAGRLLPVYQFALRGGRLMIAAGIDEAVEKALEALSNSATFPADLFRDLCEAYLELDAPLPLRGIITGIIDTGNDDFYPLLERIITSTRQDDLHHYAVIMLGAARQPELIDILYRQARICSSDQISTYIEAVELTMHDDRDDLLAMLRKRQ